MAKNNKSPFPGVLVKKLNPQEKGCIHVSIEKNNGVRMVMDGDVYLPHLYVLFDYLVKTFADEGDNLERVASAFTQATSKYFKTEMKDIMNAFGDDPIPEENEDVEIKDDETESTDTSKLKS
ncbi:hypothetical protein [Breznakia pachnodae]|uniref:Uncharacterized protein n=1 Tax=Breznakia pachnodae TaxID=265178 RepID=A0ABU0E3X7_9FIRM|nr:hypothetical protein [Breznakia pachnodae]MDQ0361604.1 hypothetical protein [Breznakia pachnodae]